MSEMYITITEAGSGAPWLTMVHGMTQDHRAFSSQVAAFKARYNILLVDLPGHGLAKDVDGPYGHMEMTAHVRSCMDQADIPPCHYWATHTGTAIGLLLAVSEPERFKSLILEGCVISGYDMPYVFKTLAKASETAKSDGIAAALKDIFYMAEWFDVMRADPKECRAEEHWQMLSDFSGKPWTYEGPAEPVSVSAEQLQALKLPILVYNGEHDLDEFVDGANRIERLVPNVERQVIPGGGGFPAWEYPGRVNPLVGEFLSRQN